MTAREFDEWMAYYTLEPWGVLPGDVRAAIVAQTVAAVHSDQKKAPPEMAAFMPAWSREMMEMPHDADANDKEEPVWKRWKGAFALLSRAQRGHS